MSPILPDSSSETPVTDLDELAEVFRSAEKPRSQWRIGLEAEKFGLRASDGAPLMYEGEHSVLRVLDALVVGHGWTPKAERPGGPTIALERGDASVTLEPGGQLELSGTPSADVHAVCAEAKAHLAELREISREMGLVWLGLGFQPFARQADLPWVPKQRYGIMKRYLPTRGSGALDMMRRTATVQCNLDFSNERDAMRKLRVALVLSPLVNAIFANSPLSEGKLAGKKSVRGDVWLHMDPSRSGLIPAIWSKPEPRYRDYVEYALDAGMFLFKRGDHVIANTGQTFREFMRDGFAGHRATMVDWKLHLNTLFPEARLKGTLEMRTCDALPGELCCAVPALYTGLLYDEPSLERAEALSATLSYEDVRRARPELVRVGLSARIGTRLARDLAQQLIDIALGGLARRSQLDADGKDERVHLTQLAALTEQGLSPADVLIEGLTGEEPDLRRIVLDRAKL